MSVRGRFVFDTNVLVSSTLFKDSVPGRALASALSAGTLLLSSAVIDELTEVLARPKFDRYVSRETRVQILIGLIRECRLVAIDRHIAACRDPKDNKFLELSVCGGASSLVSGDDDLLALDPFEGVRILTPAAFLESLKPPATSG